MENNHSLKVLLSSVVREYSKFSDFGNKLYTINTVILKIIHEATPKIDYGVIGNSCHTLLTKLRLTSVIRARID